MKHGSLYKEDYLGNEIEDQNLIVLIRTIQNKKLNLNSQIVCSYIFESHQNVSATLLYATALPSDPNKFF